MNNRICTLVFVLSLVLTLSLLRGCADQPETQVQVEPVQGAAVSVLL